LSRLSRYINMLHIFLVGGGYKRADYLKKKGILKHKGRIVFYNHGILDPSLS
jgi:hypothetical protein